MSEVPIALPTIRKLERFEKEAGMLSWVASVDHKQIGILYLVTA